MDWWQSDAAVEDLFRDRWEDLYGYDPLDPEDPIDADYEDEVAREKYDRRDR